MRLKGSATYIVKRSFPLWERLGFHITPVHFYEPIPDTRELRPEVWSAHTSLAGIDMNEASQLEVLRSLAEFSGELADVGSAVQAPGVFHFNNGLFDHTDARMLYALLRLFKPTRVVEVGSGYSSLMAARALAQNREEGKEGSLVCIEPYPREWLRTPLGGRLLLEQPVQETPIDEFSSLAANDVLFIDSSHVVRIAGDVRFEFLELLPRLAPGVLVHVHDIFLPEEYPEKWVLKERRFWTEQYLLQAFLAFNNEFEVLLAGNWLRINHGELLVDALGELPPGYRPGSFWMRRRVE